MNRREIFITYITDKRPIFLIYKKLLKIEWGIPKHSVEKDAPHSILLGDRQSGKRHPRREGSEALGVSAKRETCVAEIRACAWRVSLGAPPSPYP